MTPPDPVLVRVTKTFQAPADRVFNAWLDPVMIGKWMFGPALRDEEILSLKIDARVGGKFSFLVRRDGQDLEHMGTYLELDAPTRLAFSWGVGQEAGDSSVVTVEVKPLGDACELTLTHQMAAEWAEYASRTEAGWTRMLGALESAIAGKYKLSRVA